MPCRLATAETGSRSASRMIATICSSENRPFRIAPSESGASLSTYRWSENLGAGHQDLAGQEAELIAAGCVKVYREKVSGAKTDRAELAKLIRRLEPGDVLVVTRLD